MSDIDKKVSWKYLDKNKCVYTNTDADTASNNCYCKAEDILQKLRDRKLKNCGEETFDKCVIHFPEIYPSAKLVVTSPDNKLIEIGNDPYFATCFKGAINEQELNGIYSKLGIKDTASIQPVYKNLHPNAIISGGQSPVTKNNEGEPVPYYSFIPANTYVTYVENTVRQDIKDALKNGVNELAEKAALINLTCEVGNAEIALSCYDDKAHYVESETITKTANEQVKSVPYSYSDSIFDKDYYSKYTIFDAADKKFKTFNNISEDDFVIEEGGKELENPAFEISGLKEGVKIYFNYIENGNADEKIMLDITGDQAHFGEIFDGTKTSITTYPNRLLDTYILFETSDGKLYALDFDIVNRLKDISTVGDLSKSDLYYFTNKNEYPKHCLSFKAKVEINEQAYNQALSELKCNYQNLGKTLNCPNTGFDKDNTQVQITKYTCDPEDDTYDYDSSVYDNKSTLVLLTEKKKDEEGNEIDDAIVILGEYIETISRRDLDIDTISFLNTSDFVHSFINEDNLPIKENIQEYTQSKIKEVFGGTKDAEDTEDGEQSIKSIKEELVEYTNNTLMSRLQCQYGNPKLSAACKGNAKINCDGNTRELAPGTYSKYLDVESIDEKVLKTSAIELQKKLTESAAKEITDKLCLECKIANIEINMFCDKASAEVALNYMRSGVKYINLTTDIPDAVATGNGTIEEVFEYPTTFSEFERISKDETLYAGKTQSQILAENLNIEFVTGDPEKKYSYYFKESETQESGITINKFYKVGVVQQQDKTQKLICDLIDLTDSMDSNLKDFPMVTTEQEFNALPNNDKEHISSSLEKLFGIEGYNAIQKEEASSSYFYDYQGNYDNDNKTFNYFRIVRDATGTLGFFQIKTDRLLVGTVDISSENKNSNEENEIIYFPTNINELKLFLNNNSVSNFTVSNNYLFNDIDIDSTEETYYYLAIIPKGYSFGKESINAETNETVIEKKSTEEVLEELKSNYALASDRYKEIVKLYIYKNNYIGTELSKPEYTGYEDLIASTTELRFALDEMGQTKETIPSCVYFESAKTNSAEAEAQAYLRANKYAIDQAILSVYCMYGNIYLPGITCETKFKDSEATLSKTFPVKIGENQPVPANTYVGITPKDADITAYNARNANLFCLADDWMGGGSSSVTIDGSGSCSGGINCCWMW